MSLFIFVPFRVGEEREGAVKCLDDERQVYERELSLLQQQQQKVLTDRNGKNYIVHIWQLCHRNSLHEDFFITICMFL